MSQWATAPCRVSTGDSACTCAGVGRDLRALEAEVVVAVHRLAGATGVDDVDLAGHLVARAEPRARGQRDDVVRVVVDEGIGVGDGKLLQRVPHPVVGARGREVVPGRRHRWPSPGRSSARRPPSPGRRRRAANAPRNTTMPGPVGQGPDHLGLHAAARSSSRHRVAQGGGVVDEHPLGHRSRRAGSRARSVPAPMISRRSSRWQSSAQEEAGTAGRGGRVAHGFSWCCGGVVAGQVTSVRSEGASWEPSGPINNTSFDGPRAIPGRAGHRRSRAPAASAEAASTARSKRRWLIRCTVA